MMRSCLLVLAGAILAATAHGAAFELSAAPSRIETTGKPGARVGQTINLTNLGNASTEVAIRTLDWSYSDTGDIAFHEELTPGSCRPWVTLERRTVRVVPRGRIPFRFQVEVPPDAKRGECTFMIAIEGVEPAHRAVIRNNLANLSLPVSGRLAIAVYVAIDGAAPKLEVVGVGVREVNATRLPFVTIINKGEAHGRLDGALDAQDAAGLKFELVPDGSPIFPGQTRSLTLQPRIEGTQAPPKPKYPIQVDGQLDWELGGFKIKSELK